MRCRCCQCAASAGSTSLNPRTDWYLCPTLGSLFFLARFDLRANELFQAIDQLVVVRLVLDLAVFKDGVRVAPGDAERGFARLAGAIDHAADHGDVDRLVDVLEAALELG